MTEEKKERKPKRSKEMMYLDSKARYEKAMESVKLENEKDALEFEQRIDRRAKRLADLKTVMDTAYALFESEANRIIAILKPKYDTDVEAE